MRLSIASCVAALAWAGTAAADPLDKPFAATPAELLAAAKQVAASDDAIDILRDDTTITYDERGRATRRFDTVIVVEKPDAIDTWNTYEADWSPSYQDKPAMRARVIAPDGTVRELDPKSIADAPAVTKSPLVFSDRRATMGALPQLAVGSVIVEEVTLADRVPQLAAGSVERAYVGRTTRVERAVITFDAPTALALHVVTRGLASPPVPRKTAANGRTTWTYAIGATPGVPHDLTGVPADVAEWPYVGVATGASWAAIAKDYRRLVDERIADFALPDGVRGATPRETVDRAVAWLHAHVRYTGIDLRDDALAPVPPASTVTRGFADGTSESALLVALLRGAGIRADLAVISAGPSTDVDRDLPGLGSFDHAIVRAQLDGKDLWIDATEPDLPAGQLPSGDQGRLALVAADDTRDLAATPIGASADNLIREVRTYHVSEESLATATERDTEHGALANEQRAWVRDTARAELTRSLSDYADHSYGGKLSGFSDNHPADVTQPFELTIELANVSRVFTARDHIDIWLQRTATFGHLPDLLSTESDANAAAVKARTIDYVWWVPHVYEIENRLELPPGYQPPALVAREQQLLGTMTFTTTRAMDRDTIVITYRLDTGKRRVTAAELARTRDAVQALEHAEAEHLTLPLVSAQLAKQGKITEAIAEAQRVIKLHPKHAIHDDQLASIYHDAGMGAAARRAARDGVRVEPTSGDAYDLLAYELRRDTTGHEYGFDADRAGAIAAYRKALALRPDHEGAISDLASLLSVDEHGAPTASKRDLEEAIAVLREGKALGTTDTFDRPLVDALVAAGQYAEAEEAARALPASDETSIVRVVIAAVLHGGHDAFELGDRLATAKTRWSVLKAAVNRLEALREYEAVRAIIQEAGGPPDKYADLFANLDRVDPAKLSVADPKRVALLASLAIAGDTIASPPWDAAMAATIEKTSHLGMHDFEKMSRAAAIDMMAASFTATGYDRDGWKITMEAGGRAGAFYVAMDHGHAILVGMDYLPSGIGRYALALVARKDVAAAGRWIDRQIAELEQDGDDAKGWAPIIKLYRDELGREGGKAPSRELIETIAAIFANADLARSEPILRRCAIAGDAAQMECKRWLMYGLIDAGKWSAAAELAMVVTPPDGDTPHANAYALERAGKLADAEAALDAYLAKHPDDPEATYQRGRLAIVGGSWKDAQPYFDKVIANRDVTIEQLNAIAWLHIIYDADASTGAALAHTAEHMGKSPGYGLDNTIALAEAETGDPQGAWTHLDRAISFHRHHEPSFADWYVLGRIAESYGLRDDAIADYHRALADPDVLDLPETGADLARKRLAALHAP